MRLMRRMAGPRLIKAFADANPGAYFVEIGSNDGEQHDHLRPYILGREWRGIMVEPVPYIFERLARNYAAVDRVILENVAIADRDGERPFHYLVDASAEERRKLPDWYDGVGSFSREALLSHAAQIPDVESRMITARIPVMTFESLCAKHGADRVDLVLIDTEGYDWEILRSIDFARFRPQVVVYEHFHLAPADRRACAEYLAAHGYETMEEGFDTFCLASEAPAPLRDAWRGLEPAVPGVSKADETR
jgi:FkbM family methyltransferase